MNWIDLLFGHGKDLTVLQMACRALLTFCIAVILLRITGVRTFGRKSSFDNVIVIMLGSILSRVVVGASPFIGTTVACFVFALVHWLLAKLSYRYEVLGKLVKGEKVSLYRNGRKNEANMRKTAISDKDIEESVRISTNSENLARIKEIFMERNGEISIVKKESEE